MMITGYTTSLPLSQVKDLYITVDPNYRIEGFVDLFKQMKKLLRGWLHRDVFLPILSALFYREEDENGIDDTLFLPDLKKLLF